MITYHPIKGFKQTPITYSDFTLGTYHLNPNTKRWRLRVTRRGKGLTWKRVKDLPKTIKMEALILGIQL